MKVRIDEYELFPCYYIVDGTFPEDCLSELLEEEVLFIQQAINDFRKAQDIMRAVAKV